MSKQQTRRTTGSRQNSTTSSKSASAKQSAPAAAKNESPQPSEQPNDAQASGETVEVPEDGIQWVKDAETYEEAEKRADAVYSKAKDGDTSESDLQGLADALRATMADRDDTPEDDGDDDSSDEEQGKPSETGEQTVDADADVITSVDPDEDGNRPKPPKNEQAPDGKIIEPGQDVTFEGTTMGNMVRVDEDVYRKVYPRNTLRPSYLLLYRKGMIIPLNSLKKN